MEQLWSDLKELMDARTQALAGAKEIHTFDRDAADTKERVQVRHLILYCTGHQSTSVICDRICKKPALSIFAYDQVVVS